MDNSKKARTICRQFSQLGKLATDEIKLSKHFIEAHRWLLTTHKILPG